MKAHFIIYGRLPSLNEIIKVASYNRYSYGSFKRKWTSICAQAVLLAKIPIFKNPVSVSINYFEPNKKRDLDGIFSGGMKFILDALGPVAFGGLEKIHSDSRIWVKEVRNVSGAVDPKNPRVEVIIEEWKM